MPIVRLPSISGPFAQPDDYAVVVSINDYLEGIPTLKGAINDGELFCEWLVNPVMGGLNPDNVYFYASQSPTDSLPIRSFVEDHLGTFFTKASGAGIPVGRRLYLFLAGHGYSSPNVRSGPALVMANARSDMIRGLLGWKAADAMHGTGIFSEVMLVMDCCAEVAGHAELDCFLPRYLNPSLPQKAFVYVQAASVGAMTAEQLMDHPLRQSEAQRWQGLLTNTLLKALVTAADPSGDVTSGSLKRYIEASLKDAPPVEMRDAADGSTMTFGIARGVTVPIRLSPDGTRYQIREGKNLSVVIPPRRDASARLAPGFYVLDEFDELGRVVRSEPLIVKQETTYDVI